MYTKKIQSVLENISVGGEIKAEEINQMVCRAFGEKVNCYPGIYSYLRTDVCFFVSLTSNDKRNGTSDMHGSGKGHLSFKKATIKIIQHMQNSCCTTKHAIFITDSWNAKVYDEWRLNFEEIQEKAILDVYMLTGDNYSKIKA